ncbi:MAG: hypothetical protein ACTHKQ_11825, partial [Mesorhizobium sp.]
MPDLDQLWGEDLSVSASGDIATVDGDSLTTQRILRRLMTSPGDYIWNPTYGAGLPQRIGSPDNVLLISSIIRSQIALE